MSATKDYVLKLMKEDFDLNSKRLDMWHKMEEKWRSDEYQIKRRKALETKLIKIEKFIENVKQKL
jgi:hypothetical protein